MMNHKNLCKNLTRKGGTITFSSNDQPSIRAFSIGKEGSVSRASWERFGRELREREQGGRGRSHAA